MVLSRTYIAIVVAFAVGVIGAVGFSVHAQSIPATTTTDQVAAVSTTATQVSDGDGEQPDATEASAQDASGTDLETADDGQTGSADATDAPDAPDTGSSGSEVQGD